MVELSLDKWITSGLLVGVGFQLMSHESDFGWGKPVWVSSASSGVQNDERYRLDGFRK